MAGESTGPESMRAESASDGEARTGIRRTEENEEEMGAHEEFIYEDGGRMGDYEGSLHHEDGSASSSSGSSDYILSDDDSAAGLEHDHLHYNTLTDHAAYLTKTLSFALDSLQLDKSLVLQARMSGQINNENQRILEKKEEIIARIERIKSLYEDNFSSDQGMSKITRLQHDILAIEGRIGRLVDGSGKEKNLSSMLGLLKTQPGVAGKYPVEYNQAKDKVLERILGGEDEQVEQW